MCNVIDLFQLQKIMEMTTRNVRQQSSKNPKPFVYVGPGFPTLFYPRGPKKIRKFPGFVVHKSSYIELTCSFVPLCFALGISGGAPQ